MKTRTMPISITRNVMSAMQIHRRVSQRGGVCCSSRPRYGNAGDGGPYRGKFEAPKPGERE